MREVLDIDWEEEVENNQHLPVFIDLSRKVKDSISFYFSFMNWGKNIKDYNKKSIFNWIEYEWNFVCLNFDIIAGCILMQNYARQTYHYPFYCSIHCKTTQVLS